jgi:hypothetical protein
MPNWREDLPMIIVDIDGTIADSSKRLQDIGFDPKKPREEWPQKPSDWGDHMTDRPIFPMIHIVNDLYESNFIWIVTIRHPIPDTIRWLETHGVCHDQRIIRCSLQSTKRHGFIVYQMNLEVESCAPLKTLPL